MRFKATLTYEYEVDPKNYDTEDVEEMCKIDKDAFENEPKFILMDGKIKVEKI